MAPLDLFAAFVIAYLILRILTTGCFWPVEVVSVIAHWLLLVALFLTPLAYWIRRWPTLALLAVGGVAYLWLFGGLFLPSSMRAGDAVAAPGPCRLVAMTYNLSNGIADPAEITDVILRSSADIVGVQEFTQSQITAIQADLRRSHPYQVTFADGMSGLGLFSRSPILQEDVHRSSGSRAFIDGSIATDGCRLRVLVAHPTVVFGPGAPQSPERASIPILADLASSGDRTVLLGDFNFTDQNEGYEILRRAGWVDAFRASGTGFGFTHPKRSWSGPLLLPVLRIDFIFVTPGIHPVSTWVGQDGGSDHLPVLAELTWDPKAAGS
jgi:vancomycin resistance protein VanJ